MKVLLDENIPHDLRPFHAHHSTFTVAYKGWGGLKNGKLLDAAEADSFDVLMTGDKTLEYEQNPGRSSADSLSQWRSAMLMPPQFST